MTIEIAAVNDPPVVVGNISEAGYENAVVEFVKSDFTGCFTDADGDSLTQIQIISLPENGILRFLKDGTTEPYVEVTASENNIILADELNSLIFEPAANWYGTTGFDWKGYDGKEYSNGSARVSIDIIPSFSPEFRVNISTDNDQSEPAVAKLNDGSFVIVWQSFAQDGDNWGIYGQIYNADGNKIGSEFLVNTCIQKGQAYPSVAALNDGGFIVTWQSWQEKVMLGDL